MDASIDGAGVSYATQAASTPDDSSTSTYARRWQQASADAQAAAQKDGGPGTASAGSMIAAVTDPNTGAVDTKALAATVAQAMPGHMDQASKAYSDLSGALAARNPADAQHFAADVRAAVQHGPDVAAGASRGLSNAGRTLLTDNPILTKRWESTQSPWTGKGGFTDGLQDMLRSHGIEVAPGVNPAPVGGLDRTSGVPQARANNVNGSLARDDIADRYRQGGARVQTEVPTQGGSRRVDVRADVPNKDPRYAERIDTESKLGRTSDGPGVRTQALKDGEALVENLKLRGLGAGLEKAGKVALPLAIAGDALQLGQAYKADGGTIGKHTGEAASGIGGAWAGAEAGGELGAELGSLAGPEGTVIGGVVGGIVGGIAGSSVGKDIFKGISSLF